MSVWIEHGRRSWVPLYCYSRPTRFWMSVDMKDVVGVQLGKVGCQSFHCLAMSVDCFGE